MIRTAATSVLLLAATAPGCASTSTSGPPPASVSASGGGRSGDATSWRGVVVPTEYAAVSLWTEAWSGELLVLEARAPGARVDAGDVLVDLDTRDIDEALADAERDRESALVAHQGLLERNAIAAEVAAARLAEAEAGLDRARRSLEGYEKQGRAFTRRSDEITARYEAAREDDQVDELEQLEAMYAADELVDATEDIVLKRQRRDLALTRARNALSNDRRVHRQRLSDTLEAEVKREQVAKGERELAHLRRTQAVEARARRDARERSAAELAKKEERLARLRADRELFSIRAPRAGVLLHGSPDELRRGPAKRIERGTTLARRRDLLVVAEPGRHAVALEVPESKRALLASAEGVTVQPVGTDLELSGTVAVAALPSGSQGDESTFEATVELMDGADLVPGTHAVVELGGDER